jgi:FkbH-like protein
MIPEADVLDAVSSEMKRGDELRRAGRLELAIDRYLAAAQAEEVPRAGICLRLAQCYERIGHLAAASQWAIATTDGGDDFPAWHGAASVLARCATATPPAARSAKLAILSSYTTTQFEPLLVLIARRFGITLELYTGAYGQYNQEIRDRESGLYRFDPDFVLLAVHERDLALPEISTSPTEDIETELRRWTSLWDDVAARSKARVIQFNFAQPGEAPFGHLGARLAGSRYMMTTAVNARLGAEAGPATLIVDCERLSGLLGKDHWFDPRYWFLARQAVALNALPLLARHTASVLAAALGLSKKCLVLDLDNTLWGGVIGEDGLSGITLGEGVDGEAFVAFQEYLLRLKRKGVMLAVCSKNNENDVRQCFEQHPEMRIKLDDLATFVANWQSKADNLRKIATALGIGLDALVFIDDNPVERAAVRQALPQVDVIPLPSDPAKYVRALSSYVLLEIESYTAEDTRRDDHYRHRQQVSSLEAATASIEDFYCSLQMRAEVSPFTEIDLPRIVQLLGKTNQFNLTSRRHSFAQVRDFIRDPRSVHFSLRLRDRFGDHGLVSLLIAQRDGEELNIDTFLMSCRVIGRTVEATMLQELCRRAVDLGCRRLRGVYIATAKNSLVADLFSRFEFELENERPGTSAWIYDLQFKPPISNEFVEVSQREEAINAAASGT